MADRVLLESSAVDGYLLEDGTGVLLLEASAAAQDPPPPIRMKGFEAAQRASRW